MKKRKMALCWALALACFFSPCLKACDEGVKSVSVKEGDVEIWSTAGTEKILQDKLDGYDGVKGDAEISTYAVKGEKEGTHLILTSRSKDVKHINLTPSDLSLQGDPSVKFDAENINVFFEKYLSLTRNYEKNGAELGNYPDALVPMEKIVEYGENVLKAGNNQGLYVRFDVPEEQKEGVYHGTFTLSYGGLTKEIPVELEVYNYAIGQETHLRTLFIDEWQYRLGELDSTQAMLEKYIKAGLDYRISPAGVTIEDAFDDDSIAYYVDTAAKFMVDPRCTHISLPLRSKSVSGVSAIDGDALEKVLNKFVEKSLADEFDYVRKLGCHLVDEPQLHDGLTRTHTITKIYYDTLNKVADEVLLLSGDGAFLEELSSSVRNIRGIITASYDAEYAYDEDLGSGIKTWCPTVDFYNGESARAIYDEEENRNYGENAEKWWYTCISPRVPYPTYHIEDTLLSARVMSWMQAEYDVVGNLYWATNIYANYTGERYENIEDFYSGNACRYSQVNGDGYLFYPGKVYGIDGPVGSLRLEAIRDGIEEYEILYALKNEYATLSDEIDGTLGSPFDAKSVIGSITTYLYSGTQVATNGQTFDRARRTLLNLALLSQSGARFTITDFENDNFGKVNVSVYVNDGYELKLDGQTLENGIKTANGKVYSLSILLNENENVMRLEVKNVSSGESYLFTENIGGKVIVVAADGLTDAFASNSATVSASLVDFSSVDASKTGKVLKLDVSETFGETQKFRFVGPLLKQIDAQTKSFTVKIYGKGFSEDVECTISAKLKSERLAKELFNGVLKNGENEIEMTFNLFDLSSSEIEYITFTTGKDRSHNVGKTIYVENVVFAGK